MFYEWENAMFSGLELRCPRTSKTHPNATAGVRCTDHNRIALRQFAGIVIEPRPIADIDCMESIKQLVAVVHPVLDVVIKPKLKREAISLVYNWR
jgi:hypothetical protein